MLSRDQYLAMVKRRARRIAENGELERAVKSALEGLSLRTDTEDLRTTDLQRAGTAAAATSVEAVWEWIHGIGS